MVLLVQPIDSVSTLLTMTTVFSSRIWRISIVRFMCCVHQKECQLTRHLGAAGEEVHEFKPKWLLQSPSAPKDAVRCRQCARSAQENVKRRANGKPCKQYLCPLDAVSDDPRGIAQAASLMGTSEGNRRRIKRWLEKSTLLKRLRQLQAELYVVPAVCHHCSPPLTTPQRSYWRAYSRPFKCKVLRRHDSARLHALPPAPTKWGWRCPHRSPTRRSRCEEPR